ncbi:unnamed protein product [Fusarium fujikuroi]|uniref:Uncharacterized protein n=1 Tax=Fusarium fujikuroi TaxID=5127 RepID=A0A9Q9RLE1_FUSFU|nr:unnamed protein product [Fusarium fujikuroi]
MTENTIYEGYLSQLGLHDDFIYRIIIDDFNDQQLRRDDLLTRRSYADILADSRAYTLWLLAAPDIMFNDLFRMNKGDFYRLSWWLKNNT